MRILVTGATGFLGSRLLARLASEADQLRVLRRKNSLLDLIKNIKFEDYIGDITNPDDVMSAVAGCDVVFHVAASVSYWDKLKEKQFDVNVNGTKYIVEACLKHKVKRLICTSSIVAIGLSRDGGPADEDTTYNLWPYRIGYCDTKYLAEVEVQRGVRNGLDAVVVNPGAIFGPGDLRRFKGNLYGGSVWRGIFYVGGGIATVDVDDVVEGHIRAWQKGRKGERYLLTNENCSFKEIYDTIMKALGKKRRHFRVRIPTFLVFTLAYIADFISKVTNTKPLVTLHMAKFTKLHLYFSNEKAKHDLDMNFRSLRESIERSISWFKEHGYL